MYYSSLKEYTTDTTWNETNSDFTKIGSIKEVTSLLIKYEK